MFCSVIVVPIFVIIVCCVEDCVSVSIVDENEDI